MIESLMSYLRDHAGQWLTNAAVALATIVVAYLIARVAARMAKNTLCKRADERVHTLGPILGSFIVVAGTCVGIVMGLEKLGLDISALIAGAGVVGLAIGFGAQSLVKDWLSGFFLILDGALAVGDFVEISGKFGVIEKVGLRVTQVRSFDGKLWYIPNGEIRDIGNLSRDWVRAVVNVGLAYEQDAAKGLSVMTRVGQEWADDHPELALEPPEAQGILNLATSSVDVRLVAKLRAEGEHNGALWAVERELRRRIKVAFDEEGIEIPFARSVVYHRQEEQAPPLEVVSRQDDDAAAA